MTCDHGNDADTCSECEQEVADMMYCIEAGYTTDANIRAQLQRALDRVRQAETEARNIRRAMVSWGIADRTDEGEA